jgi:hypothetical protein
MVNLRDSSFCSLKSTIICQIDEKRELLKGLLLLKINLKRKSEEKMCSNFSFELIFHQIQKGRRSGTFLNQKI